MRWFDVSLHNAVARVVQTDDPLFSQSAVDLVERSDEDWAQTHYLSIQATDVVEARLLVEQRYPSNHGFVIEAVTQA